MAAPIAAAAAKIAAQVSAQVAKVTSKQAVKQVGKTAAKSGAKNAGFKAAEVAGADAESTLMKNAKRAVDPTTAAVDGVRYTNRKLQDAVPGGIWGLVGIAIMVFIITLAMIASLIGSVAGSMGAIAGGMAAAGAQNSFCGATGGSLPTGSVKGINPVVLDAIKRASASSGLDWAFIAGIMSVESPSTLAGKNVSPNGDVYPKVIGPALDGTGVGGNWKPYPDTDNGVYDGDTVWDHAVGPMQFMMFTWMSNKMDGDGDGDTDPNNVYDAVAGAAKLLVANGAKKDPFMAAAKYNGGGGGASNPSCFCITTYAPNVMKATKKFQSMGISTVGSGATDHVFPVLDPVVTSTAWHAAGDLWSLGWHTGQDFGADVGDPVLAAAGGTVKEITDSGTAGYGLHIILAHPDGSRTLYGHLSRVLVKVGATVTPGQQIAKSGNSGNSTGPHLHFEVRKSPYAYGDDVDPLAWLGNATKLTQPTGIGATSGILDATYVRGAAGSIFVVGDSLTVGVRDTPTAKAVLDNAFAGASVTIVAEVGKSTDWGISKLTTPPAQKARTWIVGLGTNDGSAEGGSISKQDYAKKINLVMRMAGPDRAVVWINVYRPFVADPKSDPVNLALAEASTRYPNLALGDWNSMVLADPSLVAGDTAMQIHTGPEGYTKRASLYTGGVTVAAGAADCPDGMGTPGFSNAVTGGAGARSALAYALSQVGKPFARGATGPDAFGNPGLVWRSFTESGLNWKLMTGATMLKSKYIAGLKLGDELPGDLVFLEQGRTMLVGIVSVPGTGTAVMSLPDGGVQTVQYLDPATGGIVDNFHSLGRVINVSVNATFAGYVGGGGGCQACVNEAMKYLGGTYVDGTANPPYSWNCSEFTKWAWKYGAGVDLTNYTYSQVNQTTPVALSDLQPGDLLFYFVGTTHHVSMYIGDGKMIHAASPSSGVIITPVNEQWYVDRFTVAGRPTAWATRTV